MVKIKQKRFYIIIQLLTQLTTLTKFAYIKLHNVVLHGYFNFQQL